MFVVVDGFSKIAHFIACNKSNDVTYIVELYFKDILRLHGIPWSIVSNYQVLKPFLEYFVEESRY